MTLNHYQFFVSGQLKLAKESFSKQLGLGNAEGFSCDALSLGLDHFDGGQFPPRQVRQRGGAGGHLTDGGNIVAFAGEMERRFNAFQMVYLFEALEGFLKTVFGKMLYQLRRELPVRGRDTKSFLKANPGWANRRGTPQYFRQYAASPAGATATLPSLRSANSWIGAAPRLTGSAGWDSTSSSQSWRSQARNCSPGGRGRTRDHGAR